MREEQTKFPPSRVQESFPRVRLIMGSQWSPPTTFREPMMESSSCKLQLWIVDGSYFPYPTRHGKLLRGQFYG